MKEYKILKDLIKFNTIKDKENTEIINQLEKILKELNEYYERNIKEYIEEKYEIPYTTMNVGIINGGSAVNSISASCRATIDFRIANNQHINLLKLKIDELSQKYKCNAKILQSIESFINKTTITDSTKTAGFMTEASFIPNNVAKIILGLGPVTAHEINEYITEESYNLLVEQYKNIIKETCSK